MALTPGDVLDGKVRIESEIGRGGGGAVWRGEHLGLGIAVAVKVLHATSAIDDAVRRRFTQEARALARLRSRHVVRVFDFGAAPDGVLYLVMELLDGFDLRAHLDAKGTMEPCDVATLLEQVAEVLGEAHALGIVHRDIKPANLFLVRDAPWPTVKVLDFGIAKAGADVSSALTVTGALMGTPYFMSPEQLVSPRRVDHRTDLWSLAVVAYTALVGELPFFGETVGALSLEVHSGKLAPPSSVRDGLPAAVDAWCRKALAVDRDLRFGSATELAESFRRAIEGAANEDTSLAPRPDEPPAPRDDARSRSPRSRALLFAAPLALAALMAAWSFRDSLFGGSAPPSRSSTAVSESPSAPAPTVAVEPTSTVSDPAEPTATVSTSADPPAEPGASATARSTSESAPPAAGPSAPSAPSASLKAAGPKVSSDPALAPIALSCWRNSNSAHEAKTAMGATITLRLNAYGVVEGVAVGGAAGALGDFRYCVTRHVAPRRYGDREAGGLVVANVALPACVYDKALRRHRCGE